MITENVLLAVVAGIVISVLIFVVKYGFRVEIGWLYFKMFVDKQAGISKKELTKIIQERVAEELEAHMAALESYKDAARQFDDNMRALIAHRIADVRIPQLPEARADFTSAQLLALSIKLELVILNAENHYTHALESPETLVTYLTEKYVRMLLVFDRFSDDSLWAVRGAFVVFSSWWSIVRPNIQSTITQKLAFNETAKSVFSDALWRSRFKEAIDEQTNALLTLNDAPDLNDIASGYLDCIHRGHDFTMK